MMKKKIKYTTIGLVFLFALFSCEEILLVDDISDQEVVLVTPQNNAQFTSTGVTFTWEPVKNAEKYRLQIAKPNFTSPNQIVLDTLMTKTTIAQQLNTSDYEWRVKAVNANYETAYKTRQFSVIGNQNFQNNTVSLLTPTTNLITNVAAQNLSWQAIIGATNYQVQVYNASNTIIDDQTISTTNLNYTFPQGTNQWRVRASNGTTQTLYSSRTIVVDTTVPNTPTLTSPSNGSTGTNTNVTFQWSRTPIAGSIETDKIYIYTNSALTNLQLSSQTTSPFTTSLTAGTYYWVVKAFDTAGNVSNQSTTFTLTIN
jgi:DNA-binding ferritin-like protein (Dps family)